MIQRDKITVLRSSRGGKGGLIKVYIGHRAVWTKRWVTIDQMIEIEERVRAVIAPYNRALRLIKGAA